MFAVGTASDVGTKYVQQITSRTTKNVDATGNRMEDAHGNRVGFLYTRSAVADGHGSIEVAPGRFIGGYEAARLAATQFSKSKVRNEHDMRRFFQRLQLKIRRRARQWVTAKSRAKMAKNFQVRLASGKSTGLNFGTTLAAVYLRREGVSRIKCVVGNVGDTEVLLVSSNESRKLSVKHTVDNPQEVDRIKRAGGNVSGKYFEVEDRAVQVSRSLGHLCTPVIVWNPSVGEFHVAPGDILIIASDGLWDHMSREKAAQIVRGHSDAEKAAVDLLRQRNKRCVYDNATVTVIFLRNVPWGSFGDLSR